MKIKILPIILCLTPIVANASIPYRAQQSGDYDENANSDTVNSNPLAQERRFYIGGGYNFANWQNGSDDTVMVTGKNTSSFDAVFGVRLYDTFRMEANYVQTKADYDAFSLSGDTVFVNAIIDGRIDSKYRMFHRQYIVPYVGIGAGVSSNTVTGANAESKTVPVAAGLAGIALELTSRTAIDLGYRYFYMFTPKFDVIKDFAPVSHQLRVGARISF